MDSYFVGAERKRCKELLDEVIDDQEMLETGVEGGLGEAGH